MLISQVANLKFVFVFVVGKAAVEGRGESSRRRTNVYSNKWLDREQLHLQTIRFSIYVTLICCALDHCFLKLTNCFCIIFYVQLL